MIHSSIFLEKCKERNYTLFTGTPCSYLKPFINYVIDDDGLEFVETTNEGDAVALACGAWLGGRSSVVMFQNSGLGNAVNPLTSLSHIMKIPFIGITTLRGEPGGDKDEPQHDLMGAITTELLDLMKIPWTYFPTEEGAVEKSLTAVESSIRERVPFFFVMKKNSVESYELKTKNEHRHIMQYNSSVQRMVSGSIEINRTQALKSIKKFFGMDSVLLATTGKTGRELFEIEDASNQLYMVGSMGCVLPIGLGLGKTRYKNTICVIDGDGALLMRMGNMALVGQMQPKALVHVLLDNGVHDSTGGQKTFSEAIDFCSMAQSCGYKNIFEVDTIEGFEHAADTIVSGSKPAFIRFLIVPGSPKNLSRPDVTPDTVAFRLKKHIESLGI